MAERPAPPSHESRPLDLDIEDHGEQDRQAGDQVECKGAGPNPGRDRSVRGLASKEAPSVRSPGWSESIVALSFVMWCIRSSDATARPSSWWSLLPLPHGVQRNTVGTRWSRGRCWKGMNRGRKNLSIRSGRRSFAVRGDGSCKGETRHSVIDMNVRRMKGKILPACRFYGEGNC